MIFFMGKLPMKEINFYSFLLAKLNLVIRAKAPECAYF